MSLVDQTNAKIELSLHKGYTHALDDIEGPELLVDVDFDSSFEPSAWVVISFTDETHDSDTIKLTYAEAGKLYDRLSRILRPEDT